MEYDKYIDLTIFSTTILENIMKKEILHKRNINEYKDFLIG